MARPAPVRRFLTGRRGIRESYLACWYARGIFAEKLAVRVDSYRDRCEITAQSFERTDSGDWQAASTQTRLLQPPEWEQISAWLEAGFWGLPERDSAGALLDGDCWDIRGYREGVYHEVYRHTGSFLDGTGKEVYQLGRKLFRMAGLRRFEDIEAE